jgi:TolB-like protein/predicted Ser/Thr protein kinase
MDELDGRSALLQELERAIGPEYDEGERSRVATALASSLASLPAEGRSALVGALVQFEASGEDVEAIQADGATGAGSMLLAPDGRSVLLEALLAGAGEAGAGERSRVLRDAVSTLLATAKGRSALIDQLARGGDNWREPSPGARVGRFVLERELGRGGFGVVYEARDRDLGRQVAVKVVRPGPTTEEEGKVSREAEAIARLSHPNLITLHEVGRSEHGPFLVFELLRGKDLQERMDDGPMPVQEAVHVATEVARGLAHAHAEGVIHRDLKPANVFVTNKGQVKILDFGMAHAFGRRRLSGGTPAYMAPEQWEDAPEDERTDVFALGVMLYRMLSGEYPFPEGQGKWAAEGGVPRKLDVPGAPELAELVEKMLDPIPTRRPRDGAAVLAALTPIEDRLRAKPADGKLPEHAKRRKATFGDLLAELKRRHVFRVMVWYGIFSFAVLQVTEPIMHGAGLQDWVLKVVLVTLALGFPVAVILAWVYDLTAQGVKRTPTASGPPLSRSSRFLMPLSVAVTVLALVGAGGGAWYAWKQSGERGQAAPTVAPSIAVLPFADMSPGKDQEYLADGLAEEILNVLAQVEGLNVVARTSSFSFKGKPAGIAEIGQVLHVEAVLEGSVRRDGNRIRVMAELVNARDGIRVWSKTYDREFAGVFAIQDDIAQDVARSLRLRLKLQPGAGARRSMVPEAYTEYLLARQSDRPGAQGDHARMLAALDRALALDPSFAPAWAMLANVRIPMTRAGDPDPPERADAEKSALEAAERAIALDPQGEEGYIARGWWRICMKLDLPGTAADVERALKLSPSSADAEMLLGWVHLGSGRTDKASETFRRVTALDPLSWRRWYSLALVLKGLGDVQGAREAARRSLEIAPEWKRAADVLLELDLLEGFADRVLHAGRSDPDDQRRLFYTALAEHSLGHTAEAEAALAEYLTRFGAQNPEGAAQIQAWMGRRDDAFASLARFCEVERPYGLTLIYLPHDPLLRNLHADPRWKPYLKGLGLQVN